MMGQNEVSTVASYYHLFHRIDLSNTHNNSSQFREQQHPNNKNGDSFWEEDEWTAEEEQKAETLLEQAREKCSIRNYNVVTAAAISEEGEDKKAWDSFYKQHQTNFFKDRHYLRREFSEEFCVTENSPSRKRTLVEIGCGVGNALLPLLEDKECEWTVYGLDLSKVAVDLMREDHRFQNAAEENRALGYVCDISALPCPNSSMELTIPNCCQHVADVTTLLFCLSAIAPGERMIQAVKNAAATLIPHQGVLVFRDYGRYDEAQMKLGTSRKRQLDDNNFYRKNDGTKCYYFSLDDIRDLFETKAGLKVLELDYIRRVYRNRANREARRRVWVHGRFQKII